MNFRVQVSAFNSEGGYTPLDPQETQANTPLQAAQSGKRRQATHIRCGSIARSEVQSESI